MPQVGAEYTPYATNEAKGQLDYNTLDKASPDNFGAQVGQALGQTGNMLEQNALDRQTLINKSRADDLYSTQYMPAFANLVNEFYSIKGQAAQDSYQDYIAN